ncbi:hypothetical protein [Pseudobacter ginsenosidimutans]|uniref:Uncharacterized protein n=1 Tax=Pseudobacter ginsenosidimutans TaxID=661488 RepID=A0A4V2F068_9BACT|nr:hypothetical protein [Pseudobacter ginsenosidimutans]QEC40452.1 hypothetical protein FSB84_01595 [Pseudobacter ginsenosidimutans]RZS68940.1 hypothetical protein EV199_4764 [Pseudobacter ginsenosidimutans]
MLKQIRTFMVLATTLGLLLTACKKNGDGNNDQDEQDTPVANQLKIYFDNSTVDFARYDSGFVVMQREGTGNQYLKRFVKGNKFLKIDIDDLQEGKYRTTIHLNVKMKNGNGAIWRQFRYEQDLQVLKSGVVIKGPVNELKKDWKIYTVMTDNVKSVHITIPLDCTDPYFEVYVNDDRWKYFYIERVAYKKGAGDNRTSLGAMSFECQGDCYDGNGNIADDETFKDWSAMLGSKQWDIGEYFIQLLGEREEDDLTILHSFDIPDLQ